jgi:tRNA-2-methylthio-N6-dimethylallyladenosine synthase
VPAEVKTRRLNEIIAQQNEISQAINRSLEGQCFEVLVECTSKRSEAELMGRSSQNKSCVFPAAGHKPGDTVKVRVLSSTSATLRCEVVE